MTGEKKKMQYLLTWVRWFNILCDCGPVTTTWCVYLFPIYLMPPPVPAKYTAPSTSVSTAQAFSAQKKGLSIPRVFTTPGSDPLEEVQYERRNSRIANTDGSVVFEMEGAEIPVGWGQVATDIMVSKYFRKAGVPQCDERGELKHNEKGEVMTGPERSVKQVVRRLAGCWRHWAQEYGYFETAQDAQAFEDELSYMLVHQMAAPNSPQWFNTGLHYAYGITGPPHAHYYF